MDTLFVRTVTGLTILAADSFDAAGPDGRTPLTQNIPGVVAPRGPSTGRGVVVGVHGGL